MWLAAVGTCMAAGCSGSDRKSTASIGTDTANVTVSAEQATTAPPKELAERVRAEITEPVLGAWIAGALATAGAPTDQVCTNPYAPLDLATFERAAQVGDQITSEMLLNLDAALGATAEWCRQGNQSDAAAEYADAQATASAIEARLVEIGAR